MISLKKEPPQKKRLFLSLDNYYSLMLFPTKESNKLIATTRKMNLPTLEEFPPVLFIKRTSYAARQNHLPQFNQEVFQYCWDQCTNDSPYSNPYVEWCIRSEIQEKAYNCPDYSKDQEHNANTPLKNMIFTIHVLHFTGFIRTRELIAFFQIILNRHLVSLHSAKYVKPPTSKYC